MFLENEIVDCQDKKNNWYEAKIMKVNGGNIFDVHFLAWSPKFDEKVHISQIRKLHTMTPNWRNEIEIFSKIEFKITKSRIRLPVWAEVSVIEKNKENDKMLLFFRLSYALEVIKYVFEEEYQVESDDYQFYLRKDLEIKPDDDHTTTTDENCFFWVDKNSNDICQLGTHF